MDQTIEYIVMMAGEGSTKIVNLMIIGAGLFCGGGGGEGLKYVYFWWPVSINSKLLAIVIRIYNATYLCQCWFCLFNLWWACLYANMSPSDKESVKSLWYMYRLGLWASRLFYKDVFFTGNYVKDDKDNCNGSFKLLPRTWIREDNQQAANRTQNHSSDAHWLHLCPCCFEN